jgi:predicted nucleic acid-binding protein
MTGQRAVIDSSAVVRALVSSQPDAQSWLSRIIDGRLEALAPDLVYAETGNALARYARAETVSLGRAVEILGVVCALPISTSTSQALAPASSVLALRHGVSAYDGHYLALAEAEEAVLVTADRRLADAATRSVLLT